MGGSAVNAPNQPPGGNGRGRQPPAQPPASGLQPSRRSVRRRRRARRSRPCRTRRRCVHSRRSSSGSRHLRRSNRGPAARHQPRPTPSNALPGPGRRPPQPQPAPPAAPRPSARRPCRTSPCRHGRRRRLRPKSVPSHSPSRASSRHPADGPGQAAGPGEARAAQQQPAGPRPPRVTVNGAAPAARHRRSSLPCRPSTATAAYPPQAQPAQAAPQRPQARRAAAGSAAAAARHRAPCTRRRRSLSSAGGDAARWRPRRRSPADFGAQPARRGATGERAHAVAVATLAAFAQSVRHRRQPVSHAVLPDRDLRRRGFRHRQAALRGCRAR